MRCHGGRKVLEKHEGQGEPQCEERVVLEPPYSVRDETEHFDSDYPKLENFTQASCLSKDLCPLITQDRLVFIYKTTYRSEYMYVQIRSQGTR